MTKLDTFKELLSSDVEPRYSEYDEAAKKCTGGTQGQPLPDWNEDRDVILLDLTSRSHRLACYLRRVHLFQSTGGTKSNALPEWNEEQDIILLDLTSGSHRLACYLRREHLLQSNAEDETTKEQAAATITQLLLDIIPP